MKIAVITSALIALAVLGWTAFVFGPTLALFLSLIIALPFGIYFRMSRRDPPPIRREYAYLGIVALLALIATPFLIWNWFDTGMDDLHAFDHDYAVFKRTLASQPRFRKVDVNYTHRKGGRVYLKGHVASQADHDALNDLAEVATQHAAGGYWDGVDVVEVAN